MVSQYIQLTWQKPFQMQATPEFRVEIFKRDVLSRYYKKEQTQLRICVEYPAGYLRDDQYMILSMTCFFGGTVVGNNDRRLYKLRKRVSVTTQASLRFTWNHSKPESIFLAWSL